MVAFSTTLELEGHDAPTSIQAGSMLYAELYWRSISQSEDVSILKVSIRLYEGEQLIAQSDRPLLDGTRATISGVHRAAVAVPWTTPPGEYSLAMVIYDGVTLQPLTPDSGSPDGQRYYLNSVQIVER
jgi:hypothetical protein